MKAQTQEPYLRHSGADMIRTVFQNALCRWLGVICLVVGISACAPMVVPPGPDQLEPQLNGDSLIMADGVALPLHAWLPDDGTEVRALVVALHGFNDYGAFFADLGGYLAERSIASYAYDQRGFGAAPDHGYWAGTQAYVDDIKSALGVLRARHRGVPVYVFGESMGGAVAMAAVADIDEPLRADGLILAAPAVWARETMPFYQPVALWLGAHTMPWMELTGRGLNIMPSDNIEMLRALGRDPLVIKETRIDALWGVTNLMDRALAGAPEFHARALILYGEHDEVIQKEPTLEMLARLPKRSEGMRRIASYESGYHMLIRDLSAEIVWRDIAAWIMQPDAALPSGADARARNEGLL